MAEPLNSIIVDENADLGESAGEDLSIQDLVDDSIPVQAEPEPEAAKAAKKPRKKAVPKAKAPKADDDGADVEEPPSPKAVAPKKKATPKKKAVAADGEEVEAASGDTPAKKPAPKKRTPAKPKVKAEDADKVAGEDDAEGQEGKAVAATPKKTPVKRAKATPKSKAKVEAADDQTGDDEGGDKSAEPASMVAPPPKKTPVKRTPKPKVPKVVKAESADENGEDEAPATPAPKSAGKKRQAPESAANTPKGKRGKTTAIPGTYEELAPEDKLIVDMKNDGKGWKEIIQAWEDLMGKPPGTDTLRKRWPKLEAASVPFGESDIQAMLAAKTEVEKSIWTHVSEKLKASNINLGAKVLETKYKWLQDSGKIAANGDYIAPAAPMGFAAPASADTPPQTFDAAEADAEGEVDPEFGFDALVDFTQGGAQDDGEMLIAGDDAQS